MPNQMEGEFYAVLVSSSILEKVINYDLLTCGFSLIAIFFAMILGCVFLVALVALGFRRYPSGLPIVGSCSIAISAACHPPSDDIKPACFPLKWGAVLSQTQATHLESGQSFVLPSIAEEIALQPLEHQLPSSRPSIDLDATTFERMLDIRFNGGMKYATHEVEGHLQGILESSVRDRDTLLHGISSAEQPSDHLLVSPKSQRNGEPNLSTTEITECSTSEATSKLSTFEHEVVGHCCLTSLEVEPPVPGRFHFERFV
ncbi:hypothetical protein NA57DRAFT_51929 [Rhizodiscina lignyota]|uniref:Uncharacterized protein n=1 Tax=Rhizodiscina lignyota TaxID=1504668 RepID=A0A9P4IIN9_9PEZI|nr:hypothetical protein NA57DRAFT_51929 [Rhizodiscina lignyota]